HNDVFLSADPALVHRMGCRVLGRGARPKASLSLTARSISHVGMRGRHDPHDYPALIQPKPNAPVIPTLGQLLRTPYWVWLCCGCGHGVAVALVPLMIRWGPDASSDMLRRHARCTVCGHLGATLQHPSWHNSSTDREPFPV